MLIFRWLMMLFSLGLIASFGLYIATGQDRYKRRYWVLPQCGGIYVEGMESGEGKTHTTG